MENKRKRKENRRIVGNYELLQLLGTGSFSSVWLAKHMITNFHVAIKIVNRRTLSSADSKMRFNNELLLLKKLHHPFIAELFEIIEDNDAIYCVLENVEGGSLLDYINSKGSLDEAEAHRYFSQLISALDYLHNKKFIAHRDLKAENILIDKYNNIRIIDFGFSSEFSKFKPELTTACGSPAYAAPEMIQGCNYTKSADLWSAGVVLYAMVAGILPFDDEDTQTLLQKIVYTDVVYPPTMSRSLIDLLKRLLIKNPDKRLSISQISQHPWFTQGECAPIIGLNFNISYTEHIHNNSKIGNEDAKKHENTSFAVPPICSNAANGPNIIDKSIVEQMKSEGYDVSSLGQLLLLDEFSKPVTTIYRILLKNKMTEATHTVMEALSKRNIFKNSNSQSISENSLLVDFKSSPNFDFRSNKESGHEYNTNPTSNLPFISTPSQASYFSFNNNQQSNIPLNTTHLGTKSISSSPMPFSIPTTINNNKSYSDIYQQQNLEAQQQLQNEFNHSNRPDLQQQMFSTLDSFPSQNPQQPQFLQLISQTPIIFPKKTRMSLQPYIPAPPVQFININGNSIQAQPMQFQLQHQVNQIKNMDPMMVSVFPNASLINRRRMSRPLP